LRCNPLLKAGHTALYVPSGSPIQIGEGLRDQALGVTYITVAIRTGDVRRGRVVVAGNVFG
jgi:hypothetical protein